MNALTLLKDDHAGMKKLLEAGEETTERAIKTRTALLDRITIELQAHERIEEKIFYPALTAHPKAKDIVLEGYQEHHVANILIRELHKMDVTHERWPAKFVVLKESIEHHMQEEEGGMFDQARRIFDGAELDDLGTRMETLKKELLAST